MNKGFRSSVIVTSLASLQLLAAPAGARVSLELWTFADTHGRWFRDQAERYREHVNPDFELKIVQIAFGDLSDRLRISLQARGVGAPDIADIHQGAFGSFLRGGGETGLVALNDMLEAGGYGDLLVSSRLSLYTFKGRTFGIPHGLAPVVLYYRADIWETAGFDPQGFEVWADFVEAARAIKAARPDCVPLPLPGTLHEILLRQRGSDYFDAEGRVIIDSEVSAGTMNWLLGLQDEGIAAQPPSGNASWAALKQGTLISVVSADWYAGFFKDNAPELAGLWKAAPLPAWEPGGLRTSVLGGTGAAVIATSPNREVALDFLRFAMLSIEGTVRRFELTSLFPPFIPAMKDERLHAPDVYFSGQDIGALFADVGRRVPAQNQSPYRSQLNDLNTAAFQDIVDGDRTPQEVYSQIARIIRDEMEFDGHGR